MPGKLACMRRREFLLTGGAIAGGVMAGGVMAGTPLVGVALPPIEATDGATDAAGAWQVAAWLSIAADGSAHVAVHKSEMGQGVLTALPMIIAEELDLPFERVVVELAPGAVRFRDARGNQSTGYSSSVSSTFLPFSKLGAAARESLRRAAAQTWQVPLERVTAVQGVLGNLDRPNERAHYGEFAQLARRLPIDADPPLKAAHERRLLGRAPQRRDTPAKVDGSATFAIDVRLPGMQVAVFERCPHFGGRLSHCDAAAARRVRGVTAIHETPYGVAVVAHDFWTAMRGRAALVCEWETGPNGTATSATQHRRLHSALDAPGAPARVIGDVAAVRARGRAAGRWLEADYDTPFLAHAALEPLATTAWVRADRCDLWVGTQAPSRAQDQAAKITGLPLESVHVHTQLIGGAFGRRGEWDYVVEAVELARRVEGPVKVMWSRADDLKHDFYRPAVANRLSACVDADGRLVAWAHRIAGPSVARRRSPELLARGHDFLLTQGADDMRYAIPNVHVDYHEVDLGVPVGFWRSVGHSHTGFAVECFLDEVARAARRDPLEFRLAMLGDDPRMRVVLEKAASLAGWGRRLPRGRGLGIACMESYGTRVAQVAEVEVRAKKLRLHRVVCVVDCGTVVHPGIVTQQMQGAIVFGLSAALYGGVKFEANAVRDANYDDQPILRLADTPSIEVHIVPSEAAPGGCGEPATPVIAPALVNAIRAATGRAPRSLPLREIFDV